jgi:hypothetical protein
MFIAETERSTSVYEIITIKYRNGQFIACYGMKRTLGSRQHELFTKEIPTYIAGDTITSSIVTYTSTKLDQIFDKMRLN